MDQALLGLHGLAHGEDVACDDLYETGGIPAAASCAQSFPKSLICSKSYRDSKHDFG